MKTHFQPAMIRHLLQQRHSLLSLICLALTLNIQSESATNAAVKWPSIVELKKQWDSASFEKIRDAATAGDLTAQHYLGYSFASGERWPRNGAESVAWYERAWQAGYLPAGNNLGLLYENGEIVPKDIAKAVQYTRSAAEKGLDASQYNMGLLYRDGQGVPQDYKLALQWFRRAAEQNDPTALVEIGRAFRFGRGTEKDLDEAKNWFQKASQTDTDAGLGLLNLGLLYEEDFDTPQDRRHAVDLFRQAVAKGSTDAMYKLYWNYKDGKGVPRDETEAGKWLTKSAEAGNAWAQCELGYNSEFMDWDRFHETANSNNMPVAIQWYRRSAEQNWPGGQYRLGLCYLAGKGVDKDEEQGLELIRKAADQNHAFALFKLAKLYRSGVGEPRNEVDRPIKLLLRSASLDCGLAYAELSDRYRRGLGCERDLIKSGQWHSRAGSAGISGFRITNAKIDYADTGLASDPFSIALSLYLKATQRNDQSAMVRIGDMYLVGGHVPKDLVEAWAWLRLASDQGNPTAREKLSKIETKLTAQEQQSARVRSGELKALSGRK